MKQGKTRNQNKYSQWKLHHSIRHTCTRIRNLIKTKYLTHAHKKNFLLKETEGFPHWTAPFTYCHSLFLNQFSLFSKASPSHCDLMYRPFGTNTFPYFSVVSFSTSISSSLSSISKSSSSVVHLFLSSESSATSLPVLSSADSPCFSPVGDSCVK